MDWLRNKNGKPRRRPILKREIEDAQRNTRSGHEAARWLGVHYNTYKKYARMYGIHEHHLNPSGIGIPKPHVKGKRYALADILDGKYPSYDINKLKSRLIKTGILEEECHLCSFNERRVTDYKMPLMLIFKDGDRTNHHLENMYLLCFNCAFLTVGEINNINPYKIKQLLRIDEEAVYSEVEMSGLTDEELQQALAEAREELGIDDEV
jgi:hypothetical protein